jgi:CHAT domain-containing protein
MATLRSAPQAERSGSGRLSVPVRHRPCNAFYMEGGPDSAAACRVPAQLDAAWADVGARVAAASDRSIDGDALHAAAMMDLLTGAAGNSLDRSISSLEMTARLSPEAPSVLTDLSAAYLERAGRDGDARSLIAALDASMQALDLAPESPEAQFNAALAMHRLGLFGVARGALERFIASEPRGEWASEARAALAALSQPAPPITDASFSDDSAAVLTKRHPSDVRGLAWQWLAGWGDAWREGDMVAATRWLDRARRAGNLLASVGDSAIAWQVAAIALAGVADRGVLAVAHRNFADGLAHNRAFQAQRADTAYRAAATVGARSPSLMAWATFYFGNNLLGLGRAPDTERQMRALLATPMLARDRALAARAWWTRGIVLVRDRRMDEGRGMLERSRVLFAGLGDHEFAASMVVILAEIAGLGNDARQAYDGYTAGLRGMREYPRSVWRHNALLLMSRAALSEGMAAAADVLTAEDAVAAALVGRATSQTEVQLARARLAQRDHNTREMNAAVDEGKRLAAALPPGAFRTQLEADLTLVRAAAAPVSESASAMAMLDSSVASYQRIGNYVKLLDAYSTRARVAQRSNDLARAERDFGVAVDIFAERRATVANPVERALLARQAREIVDELTMLRVNRGDAAGAVSSRERVRSSSTPAKDTSRRHATVEYTLVRDTLVALVVVAGDVSAVRTPVSAAQVAHDVEVAVAALERRAGEDVWSPPLERLHARLIAPVLASMPDARLLTVIADGSLGRVPFAALRDSATKTWLVERFTVRYASSRQMAAVAKVDGARAPKRALVVANPAIDRVAFPSLGPLTATGREMQAVTHILPDARRLHGHTADRATLLSALNQTELFHFAGHAVFDDARPERSVLAVAPRGLTASEIAGLRLPTLRLVVLSACETDRSPSGAGAGFLGLAESFLAAGAGGVVGSLWRVDDSATAAFMEAYYRELAVDWNDPAGALARTQRSMAKESPAAWAAFRYAGR